MRTKKRLVLVTFPATLISFICTFYFYFACDGMEFWVNLSFAILGSSLLGFLMSLTEYFVERRDALEEYYHAASNLYKMYAKIQYYVVHEPINLVEAYFNEAQSLFNESLPAKEELFEYMNTIWKKTIDIPEPEYSQWAQQEFDRVIQSYQDSLVKTLKGYIFIARQNLWELESAYGRLDFIFLNNSLRREIYNRIHAPIQEYQKFVADKAYHFRSFIQAKNGNMAFMIGLVDEIQRKYYKTKERCNENIKTIYVYRQFVDRLDNQLGWLLSRIYKKEFVPCKVKPYLSIS